MDEEKKINEQELESVSGGWPAAMADSMFQQNNCLLCSKHNSPNCPYYGNKAQAARDYGADGTCPDKA